MSEVQVGTVEMGTVSEPTLVVSETSNPITIGSDTVVTQSAKPAKERKPKAKVEKKRGRGRPNVYVGALMTLIVGMIRSCHNSTLVRNVLTATGKDESVADRKALLEPLGIKKPLTISLPMLGKYAKDAGIEMPKGRPSFATQVKQGEQLQRWIDKKLGKKDKQAKAA